MHRVIYTYIFHTYTRLYGILFLIFRIFDCLMFMGFYAFHFGQNFKFVIWFEFIIFDEFECSWINFTFTLFYMYYTFANFSAPIFALTLAIPKRSDIYCRDNRRWVPGCAPFIIMHLFSLLLLTEGRRELFPTTWIVRTSGICCLIQTLHISPSAFFPFWISTPFHKCLYGLRIWFHIYHFKLGITFTFWI